MSDVVHWPRPWATTWTACGYRASEHTKLDNDTMQVTCLSCMRVVGYRRATMCAIPRDHPIWRA